MSARITAAFEAGRAPVVDAARTASCAPAGAATLAAMVIGSTWRAVSARSAMRP